MFILPQEGQRGLICSQCSSSFSKVFIGVVVWACVGHSGFSTLTLADHVFIDYGLFTEAHLCWNRFGPISSTVKLTLQHSLLYIRATNCNA